MRAVYQYLIPGMWLCWAAYWWASSRNVKQVVRHESLPSRLSHGVPMVLAGLLISVHNLPVPALRAHFIPAWPSRFVIAAVLTGAGLLFSVWARQYLGTNWSGAVTIKKGHDLVTGGPYAWVRHPIYTGLLLAILGTAVAVGEWRAIVAVAAASFALWRKLRLEEHWMIQQFGEAYHAYRRNVRALIPWVL